MTDPSRLLSEFVPPSLEAWRQEVERLLKGAPFAKRMITQLPEGFEVAPLYTAADTADIPWRDSLPGQAPFVRGGRAAGHHGRPWLITQEIREATCEEFNNTLREGLARGQTGVSIVLDSAGMNGLDPDQAGDGGVGADGTSVCSLADLDVALDGVDLARFPVQIEAGAAALPLAAMLVGLARRRGVAPADLTGCTGNDPYTGLARRGQLSAPVDRNHDDLAVLTRWAGARAPGLRTLPVFETAWHEAGADLALSLGLTLSGAVATLRALEARGIAPEVAAPRFQFNVAVGTDFFGEMAKLRALRLAWSRILVASGVDPAASGTFIHAGTARRGESAIDPHVNMLRATTAAMSAVLGGADSVHVRAFDAATATADHFSRRIARNVQLVLAHECHFDQVTDPAGGSWYVESLTRDLAEAAWDRFRAVEAEGGLGAALASGWVQNEVAQAAASRAKALATRRAALVGVNQYPAPEWKPTADGDGSALQKRRSAALSRQRESDSQEAHMLVLSRLEKVMDCPEDELFETLVAAAEAGATLGEFVGVTRTESGPAHEVQTLPLRRESAPFEELRGRVHARAASAPAATRVHVLCLGDFARYMPRLDFTRGFFGVGGFSVTGDSFHTDAAAAVAAARADGAATVVLVGLDDTYAELAADVARGLSEGTDPPHIVLAGAPGDHEAAWREAGIGTFITMRSDVLAVLGDLVDSPDNGEVTR